MKTFLKNIIAPLIVCLMVAGFAYADVTPSNLWKLVSSKIIPVNSSYGLKIPSLNGSGNRCLYVDANGVFGAKSVDCGTSSMTYPGAGIAVSTGSSWATSTVDNSSNWNTAYTDRLKWDGGATDLVAATGRTSLALRGFNSEYASDNAVYIKSSGNVGIGTTAPGAKLDILGNDNKIRLSYDATHYGQFSVGATGIITASFSSASPDYGYLDITQAHSLYGFLIHGGGAWGGQGMDASGNFRLSTSSALKDLILMTNNFGDERMRIQASSGNVGISTTLPTNILSFGGNAARKIWMERHTTSNTAGNALTIQAGSCTASATDKDGGMFTLSPGASTGTGKASVRTQRLGRAASTGTSDNSLYDADIVPSELNLTDGSAVSLFEVALPTLAMAGGTIEYTISASDGTDMQSMSGVVTYSAVNKGGSYTTQIVEGADNQSKAVSAGTLTAAWSVLNGTNKVTIQLNADTSLTPTSFKLYYKIHNGSNQVITQL